MLFLRLLPLCFLSLTLILTGCGSKGPLFVPTEEERAQMAKEQAERDAVLAAREAKRDKSDDPHPADAHQ